MPSKTNVIKFLRNPVFWNSLIFATGITLGTTAVANNTFVWHGPVTLERLAEFRADLEKNNSSSVEFRNSSGAKGSAVIIIDEIERHIKHRKLDTCARGYCGSACAIAFLLGTTRTMYPSDLWMPTWLGLHPVTVQGEHNSGATDILNRKIVAASGGRFPLELLDRMYENPGSSGGLFIYAKPYKTSRGTAHVLFCRGDEKHHECEPIPKFTPEALGIRLAQ